MSLTRRNQARLVAAVVVATTLTSCSYDFEQFVEPSVSSAGASSQTGGRASSGGATSMTGSGGTSNGGASSRGTGGTSNSATSSACVGAAYDGSCWYLGASGSGCDDVCAAHGQMASTMASSVGTAAQGGSLQKCSTLLRLLGVSANPSEGTRNDGLGLGCHVYQNVAWWLTSPTFSPTASMGSTRRVCGCTQ